MRFRLHMHLVLQLKAHVRGCRKLEARSTPNALSLSKDCSHFSKSLIEQCWELKPFLNNIRI